MRIADRVAVVTGAGSGIGAALAKRLADGGARSVVVCDRDGSAARTVAAGIGARASVAELDVTDATGVARLVERVVHDLGRVDLFCSNAGITTGAGLEQPDEVWRRALEVNLMAHVIAARAVVPVMLAQGGGYLVNTASAAGLLTSPGDGPYAVSKHAAVGFAEWLAVTYGDRGIGVSVVCPLGVATPLLLEPLAAGNAAAAAVVASGAVISPEQAADAVVSGIEAGRFLILPHPEVGTFWAQKASDPDRWLAGVRRLIGRRQSEGRQ